MKTKKYCRFCMDSNRWFPDISDATLAKYNAAAGVQVPHLPVEFLEDRVGGEHRYKVVQLLPGERVFAVCPKRLGYRVQSAFAWTWGYMLCNRPDEMHELLQHWDKLLADGRDAIWINLLPEVADAYDEAFWIDGTDSYVSNDGGSIIIGEWLYRFTDMQGLIDAVDVMAHQVQHCMQVASGLATKHSRRDLEFWAMQTYDLLWGLDRSRDMCGLLADNPNIEPNTRPKVESPMAAVLQEIFAKVEARSHCDEGTDGDADNLQDSA